MKALVLEKRNGLAAVLREDGVYTTTSQPCEIGETIELNADIIALPRRRNRWLRPAVAAALALVLFTGSYSYLSVSAYAYVSLDVGETSVEVSVNRLGRVIDVSALNETSADMALNLNADMRGKKVEDAMPEAMRRFHTDGLLEDADDFIIAGVTSGSEKRSEQLSEAVERAAREAGPEGGDIYTFDVSREERRQAGERDMSGGRFAFEQRGGERPNGPALPGGGNENGTPPPWEEKSGGQAAPPEPTQPRPRDPAPLPEAGGTN